MEIVGATVRPEQREWATSTFKAPIYDRLEELLAHTSPELVAIANENDCKGSAVLQSLQAGCGVIVDKPLALTLAEQQAIEAHLTAYPQQRLLMLLTLRGNPEFAGLRGLVQEGTLGAPAFVHVRMAVQLKRAQRPPWFLDVNRSGGLFQDLLIHGLDQVEWLTGQRFVALTAVTGNLGDPADVNLRDHAAVFGELTGGGSALVEGQRLLPETVGSDYRVLVAGSAGVADLQMNQGVTFASPAGARVALSELPPPVSVVQDWLEGGSLVPQADSLRASRLALWATQAAAEGTKLASPPDFGV